MGALDLALFDWSDGHARLVGRITDPDLIEAARARLVAARRRELSRLEGPVRLVHAPEEDGDDAA